MLEHVVRCAEHLRPANLIATVGPHTGQIRGVFGERLCYGWQSEPLGTADAVAASFPLVDETLEWVLVVNGDVPLLEPELLQNMISQTVARRPLLSVLTFTLDDPGSYGRLQYRDGRVVGVVEAADDTAGYAGPVELNGGVYCVRRDWLAANLQRVPKSAKGEYYLTSLFELAAGTAGETDPILVIDGPSETMLGIDDRVKLAEAERVMRRRINERLMRSGVTIVDPETTYIDVDVVIGPDSRIEPGTAIRGATRIGARAHIGPDTVIDSSTLAEDVVVRKSWIESSTIGDNVDVGPYAHLRAGTVVDRDVHIGSYAEMKNTRLGSGTKVPHFSYLGDADIGRRVNVAAGTITANFDGRAKHRTSVGDDVFVGCDTVFVAPVEVGEGARTGAGAIVTRSVPPGKTVVGVPARIISSRSDPDGSR